MSLYTSRGVSAQKEEVHAAVRNLDKGLFPNAFCKIYPDHLGGDESFINVMHADGAGTKSILAYLYWKETGDISVWKGIAQDAIVMNLDDLLCIGIFSDILFSSTIDRNKHLIPGEVLKEIIEGTQAFFDKMRSFGVDIHFMGGETADVGDVVRTIAVNGTMTARWPKNRIVSNEKIHPGNVIVGLASFGQATYEDAYNSGIASNGLTSARHDLLIKTYAKDYPESFDSAMDDAVAYIGNRKVSEIPGILSPTRTFAPVMKKILEDDSIKIDGLIHCSGGGQTKCLKYLPANVKVIKNDLLTPPEIFRQIQESSGADDREMYQVFNMGTRLELYTEEACVEKIIACAESFKIQSQVIGRVEKAPLRALEIHTRQGILNF